MIQIYRLGPCKKRETPFFMRDICRAICGNQISRDDSYTTTSLSNSCCWIGRQVRRYLHGECSENGYTIAKYISGFFLACSFFTYGFILINQNTLSDKERNFLVIIALSDLGFAMICTLSIAIASIRSHQLPLRIEANPSITP